MNPSKGYYCIIQYCPDLSRLEAANIGVVLFCPERMFLESRTARDNARIRHFFGSAGHDWKRVSSFKLGIEERLKLENRSIKTIEDLETFIATRGNEFQITPPRPMKVRDPAKELDELFQELVGGQHRAQRRQSLPRYIGRKFDDAGLQRKLKRDLSVHVPVFERQVHIPYGYQNGRFNLIQPVRFESRDPAQAEVTACRYAVEGQSLHENPDPQLGDLQLVVVGKFPRKQSESKAHVNRVLEEHDVRLVALDELSYLIDEIRRTAREIEDASAQ